MIGFSNYDSWKLTSPCDYADEAADEGEFVCEECNNTGWAEEGDEMVPCGSCCHQVRSLDDLEEVDAILDANDALAMDGGGVNDGAPPAT